MIDQIWGGLVSGTVVGVMALSISLLFRLTKVVNFAHGEILSLGAFLGYAGRTQLSLSWPVTIVLSLGACAVLGLLIDWAAVRPVWRRVGRDGHGTLLTTFGIALLLQTIYSRIWGNFDLQAPYLFENDLMTIGTLRVTPQEIVIVGFGLVVWICFETVSRRAQFFSRAEAAAEKPMVTELMGINTSIITRVIWVCSAVLAGACGLLYSPQTVLNAHAGFSVMLIAFAAMIVGGLGKPRGSMLAGYALGIYQSVLASWVPGGYLLASTFAAVIVVLVVRPQGIFARAESVRA